MGEGSIDSPTGCSFCGRNRSEVAFLVAGPQAAICDDCVLVARRTIWSRASLKYLFRLVHPGVSDAWANYLGLLVTVPGAAMLVAVAASVTKLEPSLRGGTALLISFAAMVVCSYALIVTFAAVAKQQLVTRLLAGASWSLAAWSFYPQPSRYSLLGVVLACAMSQLVVSVRPHTTKASA